VGECGKWSGVVGTFGDGDDDVVDGDAEEAALEVSTAKPDTGKSLALLRLKFALNFESIVKRRLSRSWSTEVRGPLVVLKRTLEELTHEFVDEADKRLSLVGELRFTDRCTGLLVLLPGLLPPGVFFLG